MSKVGDKGWAKVGGTVVSVVCIGTMTTCDFGKGADRKTVRQRVVLDVWRIVEPDGTHGDIVQEGSVFTTREDCVNWWRVR